MLGTRTVGSSLVQPFHLFPPVEQLFATEISVPPNLAQEEYMNSKLIKSAFLSEEASLVYYILFPEIRSPCDR